MCKNFNYGYKYVISFKFFAVGVITIKNIAIFAPAMLKYLNLEVQNKSCIYFSHRCVSEWSNEIGSGPIA